MSVGPIEHTSGEAAAQSARPRGEARNFDQVVVFLMALAIIGLIVVAIGLVSIIARRPTANMQYQPYYRPYTPSGMSGDGSSERPLISGVVPRPADQSPALPYVAVRESGPANFPVLAQTQNIPLPITRQLLRRGQLQYQIYCAVCHGDTGRGDGMIVQRGFYPPPSYHLPRLVKEPDAHFFNVITNGYGTMFGYSDRVTPDDRWAITAYIRALQISVARQPAIDAYMQKERGVQP